MKVLMRRIVEEFGPLLGVIGSSEFSPLEQGSRSFDEISLQFKGGEVTITANAEDDSIQLREGGPEFPATFDLSGNSPWLSTIGSGVIWVWTLENQQGYVDGIQLEFNKDGVQADVQFICEASALSVRLFLPGG